MLFYVQTIVSYRIYIQSILIPFFHDLQIVVEYVHFARRWLHQDILGS